MNIERFLRSREREQVTAGTEAATLSEPDGLQEAYLVDVRLDAVSSTVWLLFDSRYALQITESNTCLLLLSGVESAAWSTETRTTPRTQWTILHWAVRVHDGALIVEAGFNPRGTMSISASQAEFYTGNTAENRGAPPDFGEANGAELSTGLARWDSEFTPAERFTMTSGRAMAQDEISRRSNGRRPMLGD